MQRIHPITFCLCFGALLLGMPVSYSTVESHHYIRLHYAVQHHKKLNAHNQSYSSYIQYILYPAAMQAYEEANSRSTLRIDIDDRPIVPKDALARLKKEMCMSPKVCLLVTSGYLRENFVEDETKDFSSLLTSLVSGFLQHGYYYKKIKERVLDWAVSDRKWGFITEWLVDEQRLSHLYTDNMDVAIQIGNLKKYYGDIYTHKNNFLKREILLWLIEVHHWPVPTNKQIREGDMDISLWHHFKIKQRKVAAYKMKVIQLLQDDKGFYVRLFCFHLLNGQDLPDKQSASNTIKLRDSFFEGKPLQRKLLSWLSSLYWIGIDVTTLIETTLLYLSNTFFQSIWFLYTLVALMVITWYVVNCLVGYFVLYLVITLVVTIRDSWPILPRISKALHRIKAKLLWQATPLQLSIAPEQPENANTASG